jgi:ankyrin repeat protein
MRTVVHIHGDGYMTCMFDLFYSFTPYQDNATPLYGASQNGHHDVVQTLVGTGADVNIARSDVRDMLSCSYTSTCTHKLLIARYRLY